MQQLIKSLLDKRGLFSTISIITTLVLLLMPSNGLNKVPSIPHIDKLAHVGVFATCAFFVYLDCRVGHQPKPKRIKTIILIWLVGVFFGYLIEIVQEKFVGRTYSLQDLFADSIGLAIGLFIANRLFKRIFL